ncbi:unnamed protein product [Nezara viridula]|uniref:Peptidase S1 domain-containing protein n=1 Tax=Nezara viridula TaxID=85310 RepID=A0A9P0E4S2_NEZVI|nr:unnamed protein product [Nezara viridula]
MINLEMNNNLLCSVGNKTEQKWRPRLGIISGVPALAGEYPSIVSIQENGFHICGGNIINEHTILTAAHCTIDHDTDLWEVDTADIVGWGATSEFGPSSSVLLKTTIAVETKEECIAEYGDEIEFGLICSKTNHGDACNGDSGGPMVCNAKELCGIISSGQGCGRENESALYIDVSYFVDWIDGIYFAQKQQELLTGDDVIAEQKKEQEEDLLECLRLNEEWNKRVALLREERLAKAKEEELERVTRVIEEHKLKAQKRKEQLEALVRKEKVCIEIIYFILVIS